MWSCWRQARPAAWAVADPARSTEMANRMPALPAPPPSPSSGPSVVSIAAKRRASPACSCTAPAPAPLANTCRTTRPMAGSVKSRNSGPPLSAIRARLCRAQACR